MNFDLNNFASFGVAGNFTGHLEQAGEAVDFAICGCRGVFEGVFLIRKE